MFILLALRDSPFAQGAKRKTNTTGGQGTREQGNA